VIAVEVQSEEIWCFQVNISSVLTNKP